MNRWRPVSIRMDRLKQFEFPYGGAALVVLVGALLTGGFILASDLRKAAVAKPDLVFATFTKEHAKAYESAVAEFEKKHNVRVQVQVVDQRALQGRLQSALTVGADVPDMVELLDGTMGTFTKGPLEDVGFIDLTDRVREAKLDQTLVTSRFGKWSSRGRIFALPHDVHPTMLVYRRDLIEKLGIDTNKLTTWEEFCRVGREITKDYNGDGVVDHYMIDLPAAEAWAMRLLILQNGSGMFNEAGDVMFDDDASAEVLCWYVEQIQGKNRISFSAGWGQNLAKAMLDGLCLFYIAPDWRTAQFEADVPKLKGMVAVMPMPAWKEGSIRTSTWGATGLAITKKCKRPDLAWELAMHLYYVPEQLGPRFAKTNILPPYIPSWSQPEFDEPREFWSNQKLGREYANLAPQVPDEKANAYMQLAEAKLQEAFESIRLYHAEKGSEGLREFAKVELKKRADDIRRVAARNVFLKQQPTAGAK